LEESIRQIAIWALPVLIAVVFHEVAHGWVAYQLGDSTAARLGRLTLNPFAHVDLFGTILVPLILIVSNAPFVFGYAKPVPVNFSNLRNPKRDMIWVAAAGPAMNLLLAFFCAIAEVSGARDWRSWRTVRRFKTVRLYGSTGVDGTERNFDQHRSRGFQYAATAAARWRPSDGRPVAPDFVDELGQT